MADQRNTVRVFVVASSEPIRRKLLRMCEEIPVVELVGVASNKYFSPQGIAELEPDLLLVSLEPEKDARKRLFPYLSQHLPHCKAVILSKHMASRPLPELGGRHANASTKGEAASAIIDPDDQIQLRAEIQKLINEKTKEDAAFQRLRPEGTSAYLYDYVEYISSETSQKTFSGMVHDITERRRKNSGRRHTEINRAESAARLQLFVEQLPGIPYIASLDNDGSTMYVSQKIEELLGFTPQQWCADPKLRIRQLHADDRHKVLSAIRQAINDGTGYAADYRIHGRDGALHWFHDEARVMVDGAGKSLFLQGAVLDITERKQAQDDLERSHNELQELITALDSLRVEEQKRLANEMHDDFGQLLAAMKIDLCTLQQHLTQQNSEAVKYLNSINELVDAMATSVRRIISDLPPKMVEDLGLFSALKSMTRNFEKRHLISCRLQLSEFEPVLDARIATAIYRMVQETLNNVAKHAHASSVEVRIYCDEMRIALEVADNGKGISKDYLRKPGSFGLIGMRERATALGGEMEIDSRDETGTAIRITIPMNMAIVHKSY